MGPGAPGDNVIGPLQNENVTLQNENATLKNENATLKNENATLKNENTTLQNENATLKNDNVTLKEKIANLQPALNSGIRNELKKLTTNNLSIMVEGLKFMTDSINNKNLLKQLHRYQNMFVPALKIEVTKECAKLKN